MARCRGLGLLLLRCAALAPVLLGVCLVIFDTRHEAAAARRRAGRFGAEPRGLRSSPDWASNGAARGLQVGGFTGDGNATDAAAAAAQPAGAKPEAKEEKNFAKRSLSRRQKVNVVICFFAGMFLIVAMAALNAYNEGRAEKMVGRMKETISVDKYVLKILKQFSVKSVQEYILQGINISKEKITIEFENLSTTVKSRTVSLEHPCGEVEEKPILTGVSGKFQAGRVAAIMGTSGAGKTTFLNLLCGKIGSTAGWKVQGSIKVNGRETQLETLKPITGVVPQDDIVHDRMTVRENIWFSAKLRNTASTSSNRLHRITNDVLQVLQLEAQQNRQVGNRATGGGLSGGQRKRVNVGLELAACPSLLFLDEPTSGLDSTGSLMLVRTLQKMTQLGMTVVMVIHQPRYGLFTLIDDVLLLGRGGRTCFFGPTDQAKLYFEKLGFTMPPNENPADWMMDVMSGQEEIESNHFKREDLPEALFNEWEQRKNDPLGQGYLTRSQSLGPRTTTDVEECEVIKNHVRDAWKRVDLPMLGALGRDDFAKVLGNCTGTEPEDEVVEEMMIRISTTNAAMSRRKKNEDLFVTHREFEKYLIRVSKGSYVGTASTQDVFSLDPSFVDMEEESDSEGTDSSTSEEGTSEDQMDEEVAMTAGSGRTSSRRGRTASSRVLRVLTQRRNRLPGFFTQMGIFVRRTMLLWWRQQTMRLMFLLVVEFAAVFLGIFDRYIFQNPPWMPINFMNAQISLSLLTSVYCLRTFGAQEELPVFWRECSHGLNKAAYFLARSFVDTLDMFLMCFGFATAYYLVVIPEIVFGDYIVPFIFVCSVSCSWGYFISCWLPFELISLGPFVSALLSFVFGGILGLPNEMGVYLSKWYYQAVVSSLSFTRWGVPMIFFAYIEQAPVEPKLMDMGQSYMYNQTIQFYNLGWSLPGDVGYWWTGIFSLTCTAIVLRLFAFVGLVFSNRSKQV